MEIFDNGYLQKEELELLSTQDLINLAVSNYLNDPLPDILPNHIFRYAKEKDGNISIMILHLPKMHEANSEVLWDDFIHHQDSLPYGEKRLSLWTEKKRDYVFDKYLDKESFKEFPVYLKESVRIGDIQSSTQIRATASTYEKNIIYSTILISQSEIEKCFAEIQQKKEVPF